ncbi:hypothetical protein GCM10007978_40730 [Shewanella hanedai]|uniref:DUF4393 domain-containing protein n=1 Tax=Shewanella hanedai TaxID=25 RepID=A0A553JKN5_SHEHA|nr:hypothetical protein [Shewanella hanedai]TRY13019.1 hypothetical protein FN961_17250 [Shewanella hanedai]GGI98788.1 hypothetical protein GCM10007978_40730 [Shewanella hanedai]
MDALIALKIANPVINLIKNTFTNCKVESALVELAQGKKNINEICNNHSDIYRFRMLIDSLNKASTLKKANVLKDLYLSFEGEDKTDESDDLFYEILSILGELSEREIRIIYLLELFYNEDIQNKKDDEKYSKYFLEITDEGFGEGGDKSDSFYYFVSEKMEIKPVIIFGLMKRLERSGLIVTTGINGNAKFQEYRHTALYNEIKSRLILAMENSYGEENTLTSDDI